MKKIRTKKYHRWTKIFCLIIYSALGSYFLKPFIHGNSEAVDIIVTVYSILAGFLIAVITLIGDVKSLPSGDWQAAQLGKYLVVYRMRKHKYLFVCYLLTLSIIFIVVLLTGNEKVIKSDFVVGFACLLEYFYLFLAFVSLVLSFSLPGQLMRIHEEKINHEISERRKGSGIKS